MFSARLAALASWQGTDFSRHGGLVPWGIRPWVLAGLASGMLVAWPGTDTSRAVSLALAAAAKPHSPDEKSSPTEKAANTAAKPSQAKTDTKSTGSGEVKIVWPFELLVVDLCRSAQGSREGRILWRGQTVRITAPAMSGVSGEQALAEALTVAVAQRLKTAGPASKPELVLRPTHDVEVGLVREVLTAWRAGGLPTPRWGLVPVQEKPHSTEVAWPSVLVRYTSLPVAKAPGVKVEPPGGRRYTTALSVDLREPLTTGRTFSYYLVNMREQLVRRQPELQGWPTVVVEAENNVACGAVQRLLSTLSALGMGWVDLGTGEPLALSIAANPPMRVAAGQAGRLWGLSGVGSRQSVVYVVERRGSLVVAEWLIKSHLAVEFAHLRPTHTAQILWARRAAPDPGEPAGLFSGVQPVDANTPMAVAEHLSRVTFGPADDLAATLATAIELRPEVIIVVADGDLGPAVTDDLTKLNGGRAVIHVVQLRQSHTPTDNLAKLAADTKGKFVKLPTERLLGDPLALKVPLSVEPAQPMTKATPGGSPPR